MADEPEKPDPYWEPIDKDDWRKLREQVRDAQEKRRLLSSDKLTSAGHAERLKAIEHLHAYGQNTVRMLFLLNGGSIIAGLTLIGTFVGRADAVMLATAKTMAPWLWTGFWCWVAGLAFIVATSTVAYLNWSAVAEAGWDTDVLHRFIHSEPPLERPKWLGRFITGTVWVAIGFGVLSLLAWSLAASPSRMDFQRFRRPRFGRHLARSRPKSAPEPS